MGEWYGVTTTRRGRVIGVELSMNGKFYYCKISPKVPPRCHHNVQCGRSVLDRHANTSEMREYMVAPTLTLRNTTCTMAAPLELHGDIPRKLGQLELLTMLNLGSNVINNSIPPEIGALVNLTTLQLNDNRLVGHLAPELGQLTNLTNLSLSWNRYGVRQYLLIQAA